MEEQALVKTGGAVASIYSKIDNPMEAVREIGGWIVKSGLFGCEKVEQGNMIALACLCDGKNPLDIERTYHIVKGKLSKKADVMLANLRQAGGEYRWIEDGSDGNVAEIEITFKGQTGTCRYTMEMARMAQLIKENGGWKKNPPNMLRARATSNGMRMYAPEIVSGVYTPEELNDMHGGEETSRPLFTPQETPEQSGKKGTGGKRKTKEAEAEVVNTSETVPVAQMREKIKGIFAEELPDLDAYCVAKKMCNEGKGFDQIMDIKVEYLHNNTVDFENSYNAWKKERNSK